MIRKKIVIVKERPSMSTTTNREAALYRAAKEMFAAEEAGRRVLWVDEIQFGAAVL